MAGVVGPVVVVEGVKAVSETITAFKEYAIARDKEVTERERVRATLEVCLKSLELNAGLVRVDLQNKHEERMKLYEVFQSGVTIAIERGDVAMVERISQTLIIVYDKAPKLADIGESMSKNASRKLTHDE
jgi:hypothetical protein